MSNSVNESGPNFNRIDPRTCVNAKMRKLHRLINANFQKKIKPFGLGGSMLSILFIIGKVENINQKAIADMLVLDQSTMSRDLKKLTLKGWVRIDKGQDARNSTLALTKEGYGLLELVVPAWEELNESLRATLGSYSIEHIDSITKAVVDNFGNV